MCFNWVSIQEVSVPTKAEFNLEVGTPVSSIPPPVLVRVFGKQKPITPHSQRLLVAARKESRAPAKADGSKGSGKGTKGRGKGAKGAKLPKGSKGKGRGKGKAGKKPKTPYAMAKEEYLQTLFLGQLREDGISFVLHSMRVYKHTSCG